MPSSALFSKQLCPLLLASKPAVLLAPLTRLLSIPAAADVPGFRGQDPQMPMALGLRSPVCSSRPLSPHPLPDSKIGLLAN